MKRRFFTLSAIFVITILFFDCPENLTKEKDEMPVKLYAIGDTGPSGVGKVFYITDGGLHGLEAAPSLWKGALKIRYQHG